MGHHGLSMYCDQYTTSTNFLGKTSYYNNDTITVSDINHTWGIFYHIMLSKMFMEWEYNKNTKDGK